MLWDAIIGITLGVSCRDALKTFLDRAGESMDASAADEATVRTFFMNGFIKNDDIPDQPTALLEDTPIDLSAGILSKKPNDMPAEGMAAPNASSVDISTTGLVNLHLEVPDKPATLLNNPPPNIAAASRPDCQTENADGTSAALKEVSALIPSSHEQTVTSTLDGVQDVTMGSFQKEDGQPPLSPVSQAMNMGSADDIPLWTHLDESELNSVANGPPPGGQSGLEPVAPQGSAPPPAAPAAGVSPVRSATSLSSLTSSSDEDAAPAAPIPANKKSADGSLGEPEAFRRASTRQPKPAVAFASGAALTAAPPAKKRMRVTKENATRQISPVKVKQEEDRYWASTQKYWAKAVSIPSLSVHLSVFNPSLAYMQHSEAKVLAPQDPENVPDAASVTPGPPVQETPVSQSRYGFRVVSANTVPKISQHTVQFTLFDGDRSTPGIPYTFQPDAHSVSHFPDPSVLSLVLTHYRRNLMCLSCNVYAIIFGSLWMHRAPRPTDSPRLQILSLTQTRRSLSPNPKHSTRWTLSR